MNKEKEGLTVRFSIRLPKELHAEVKKQSNEIGISMNTIISEAVKEKMEK